MTISTGFFLSKLGADGDQRDAERAGESGRQPCQGVALSRLCMHER